MTPWRRSVRFVTGTARRTRRLAAGQVVAGVSCASLAALGSAVPALAAPPAGAGCRQLEVTVSVGWTGGPAAAVGIGLRYPDLALDLPGAQNEESVKARVENVSGVTDGLFERVDVRDPAIPAPGGSENRVNAGLVVVPESIRPGEILRIRFECRPGQPAPAVQDFTCFPEVGDRSGQTLSDQTCSLSLRAVS